MKCVTWAWRPAQGSMEKRSTGTSRPLCGALDVFPPGQRERSRRASCCPVFTSAPVETVGGFQSSEFSYREVGDSYPAAETDPQEAVMGRVCAVSWPAPSLSSGRQETEGPMRDTPQCFIAQPLSSFSISWSKARARLPHCIPSALPYVGTAPLLGVFSTPGQAPGKQSWESCLLLQASDCPQLVSERLLLRFSQLLLPSRAFERGLHEGSCQELSEAMLPSVNKAADVGFCER